MPIHIREIVVKATLGDGTDGKPRLFGRKKNKESMDRQAIIAECMDNVLRMLKERKDR